MNPRTQLRIDLFALLAFNTIIQPIYVVYLLQAGYSATEVAFFHVLKDLAVLILQVPSGVFADLFRYKLSLVTSTILYAIAMAAFLFVSNPLLVAIGFLAWGAALAFLNGADEGYMYRVSPSQETYIETTVRYSIVIRIGWFITWIIGPIIYAISALACFIASSILSLVGLGSALILPKERVAEVERDLAQKIPVSARVVIFLLPYAIFAGTYQIIMIYQQVKLVDDGLPVGLLGIVFTLFLVGGILGSYLFKRLRVINYRAILFASNVAMVATLIVLGFHLPALVIAAAMTGQAFVNAVMRLGNSVEVNRIYEGQGVASLFSVQTMMASVIKIPMLAVFGLVADHISIELAFVLLMLPLVVSAASALLLKSQAPSLVGSRVVVR